MVLYIFKHQVKETEVKFIKLKKTNLFFFFIWITGAWTGWRMMRFFRRWMMFNFYFLIRSNYHCFFGNNWRLKQTNIAVVVNVVHGCGFFRGLEHFFFFTTTTAAAWFFLLWNVWNLMIRNWKLTISIKSRSWN